MTTPAVPNTNKAVPGPKPPQGLIETLSLIRRYSADAIGVLRAWYDTYGDVVGIPFGDVLSINLLHPDDIHEVLVSQSSKFYKGEQYSDPKRGLARFLGNGLLTSDGDFWKRQRRLAAPALHARRIASYADTMVDYTERMLGNWRANEKVDLNRAMKALTMDIVAKCLFNTDVSEEADRVHNALEAIQNRSSGMAILPPWVPTPVELRARKASKIVDEIIFGMIDERRVSGEDKGDLLSMLLLAEDDDGAKMSDKQARDEAVTLFLAGHETTANAMNWTFYLLSQHPEVEARLHHEVDTVLAGRLPTLADLRQLPYTEMIVKEVMRVYPSVWFISREAIEDVEIAGYPMPKGSVIGLPIYFLHHDPRWFPEPEKFDPERFSPENEAKIPKNAYIPFSTGPRVCIGNMFAMMEAQLILATVTSRYTLSLKPGHKVEILPRLTLNVKGSLPMTVHDRNVSYPAKAEAAPVPEGALVSV